MSPPQKPPEQTEFSFVTPIRTHVPDEENFYAPEAESCFRPFTPQAHSSTTDSPSWPFRGAAADPSAQYQLWRLPLNEQTWVNPNPERSLSPSPRKATVSQKTFFDSDVEIDSDDEELGFLRNSTQEYNSVYSLPTTPYSANPKVGSRINSRYPPLSHNKASPETIDQFLDRVGPLFTPPPASIDQFLDSLGPLFTPPTERKGATWRPTDTLHTNPEAPEAVCGRIYHEMEENQDDMETEV